MWGRRRWRQRGDQILGLNQRLSRQLAEGRHRCTRRIIVRWQGALVGTGLGRQEIEPIDQTGELWQLGRVWRWTGKRTRPEQADQKVGGQVARVLIALLAVFAEGAVQHRLHRWN